MRKKAVFSPPHWALDSRNVALLVLGAALLPGQLTRISPPGSYAPKLTLYLGLRFMPNSSCHEAEEPELHQILTPGEGSDSAKTVGLSRSRRSFVARKAKDSECSLQWSRLLLWHSVRGQGNSTWGRCHQKEEVCALESSLNLGSWIQVPS